MKLYISTILMLFSLIIKSQTIEVSIKDKNVHFDIIENDTLYFYSSKDFTGRVICYYDKKKKNITFIKKYKDGKPIGVDTTFYKNGQIQKISGPQECSEEYAYWNREGVLMKQRSCINDTCVTYKYYNSGNVMELTGEVNCIWEYQLEMCENGQLKTQFYPNKKTIHEIIHFYCNGSKKLQMDYQFSTMVGRYIEWYENGNFKTIGQYKSCDMEYLYYPLESVKIGEWKFYDENGNLINIENY